MYKPIKKIKNKNINSKLFSISKHLVMGKNIKQYSLMYIILSAFLLLSFIFPFQDIFADLPKSTNFQLGGYSFGSGGTDNNTTSTNFGVFGTTGEVEFNSPTSSNFKAGSGLTYILAANAPGAPTLSTPANNYDRIKFILNTSGNPTDTTFALQISTTSNFSSGNNYIKSDGTIGPTLSTSDYKTYTNWGGASGSFVTNLISNTTYYIRARARQGIFSESDWGPSASITTNTPTLTFSLSSPTVTFSNLNSSNSYTDSNKSTTLTTSTNAYNGYTVYGSITQSLTSPDGSISNFSSPNSAPTSWSGTGFGYTTNDTNLGGTGGANRFSSGTLYAGFQTVASGSDPVADDPGPVTTTAISNEQFTIFYRVTGSSTTKAGTYTTTILYNIVPSY